MKKIDYNDMQWYDDSLLINVDPNWYGFLAAKTDMDIAEAVISNEGCFSGKTVEAVVKAATENAMQYVDRGITDVLYCLFEQTSIVPSAVQHWRGEKYNRTEENGIAVDYGKLGFLKDLHDVYTELNVDPYKIMLDTLRENGIRPWVTLRMNDCHHNGEETAYLRSDYYYEALEKGYMISSKGTDYGYFDHCLNYAVPEVRERMLAYIEEVLGKYDMFGLELDFMREIYSFDHENDSECCEIMNDFMREVNKLIDSAELKWGHDIKLMARMARSIESSTAYGFDVKTWVEEDLVDALVPSPRWEVSDSGIPVSEWMDLVGSKDIAVFPCVETLNLKFSLTTADISKAYAASWYAQGADGLYAYNHMGYSPKQNDLWDFNREKCICSERKFVVTFQDIAPKGVQKYRPLPFEIKNTSIDINIGEVEAEDTVILTFGLSGSSEFPTVTVNGIEPVVVENMGEKSIKAPAEDGSGDIVLSDGLGIVCTFKGLETVGDVSVLFEGDSGFVDYIDFRIIPKK